MNPIVGLDVRGLQPGFKSHAGRGIGRYVRALATELPVQLGDSLHWLLEAEAAPPRDLLLGDRHPVESPGWVKRFGPFAVHARQHLHWPRAVEGFGLDLVHYCSQTDAPGRRCAVPSIISVLDLIPHRLPALYRGGKSSLRYATARALERAALRSAHGWIAISEFTKRDLVDLLGVDPDRVVVTPLGVREDLSPASAGAVAAFRRRHQIAGDYLLYVGGIDARKNLPFLFEVLRVLVADRPELELVLAGNYREDPDFPALVATLQRMGLEPSVRLLGYVADEELPALYSGARVFVFPSLYEGFGLPVLEAMACGAPVVAADRTAIPEVVGHAALLADPEDVGDFVEAVAALLDSPERRAELAAAGPRRAAAFRWDKTARATADAYRHFASI